MLKHSEGTSPRRGALRAVLASGTALALIAAVSVGFAQETPPPVATAGPQPIFSFADIVAGLSPAVVSVRIRAPATAENTAPEEDLPMPFRPQVPETEQQQPYVYGQGSGFFISADGYLVTNNHVVETADMVRVVTVDGTEYPARVIGTDPRTDIALLKVDADVEFPIVTFADTEARVGDWAIAIGNPFGLGGTVTAGIVSALGRDIGAGPYDDFLQVDAAINRGNSGGPLFNSAGQVIGVNSAIYSPTGASVGIGFAIPTHVVIDIIADLKDDGTVERGYLGVHLQGLDDNLAEAFGLPNANGALVVDADEGAPGATAGLRPRDVVTAVNGQPVTEPRDLSRMIADLDPGTVVQLTVWRDHAEQTVAATLGLLPEETPATPPPAEEPPAAPTTGLGLTLAPASAMQPGMPGVAIVDVAETGVGAREGLQAGDVILEVDGQIVTTPEQVQAAVSAARTAGNAFILLRLMSGDGGIQGYVALPLE